MKPQNVFEEYCAHDLNNISTFLPFRVFARPEGNIGWFELVYEASLAKINKQISEAKIDYSSVDLMTFKIVSA